MSVDAPERSAAVVVKLGLGFPILADPDLATIRAFGVEDVENGIAWPAAFYVAPDGTVRWRDLSADYAVRPTPATILAAIDAARR